MPKISAILPLYNGAKYISEAIESLQAQTLTDWELIIVNEPDSIDGCDEIVEEYTKKDERIHLIQNNKRLGLAESLNVGISCAKGKYIARVDADDPSYPERFAVQAEYLDSHPDIFMCGTLTRSVLPDRSYVLEAPCDCEELKAALLFGCEISHCSVMFRREKFLQNGYRYDPAKLGEDYDLWTKIMFESHIVNLPQVLVDHRWGFDNISIEKGERLHKEVREISARTLLQNFGIEISESDLIILSGWRNQPKELARKNTAHFLKKTYQLLEQIEAKNEQLGLIEPYALKKILWKRWNWDCETCGIFFGQFDYEQLIHDEVHPEVSIILPVYSAAKTLRETIDSIIRQDYSQWELVIVCENGNYDGSTELAQYYAKLDKRIKVIVNEEALGLGGSLNKGIECSKGRYIARIDADDLSNTKRLSTQIAYMDKKPNVGITQFYQHYFGEGANDFIHCPPLSAKYMKAKLLFFCDACHSTIMIRKSVLEKFSLRYDPKSQLEDYDLWTRAVRVTDFETIPEIYGEYRVGGGNISPFKNEQIQSEMCRITAKQLKDNLGIAVKDEDVHLLGGWINVFDCISGEQKQQWLQTLQDILLNIWEANKKASYYDRKALLSAIAAKWRWSKYSEPWQGDKAVKTIGQALELSDNEKRGKLFQIFIKKPLSYLQSLSWHIDAKNTRYLNAVINDVARAQAAQIDERIEHWTWERYKRIEKKLDYMERRYAELQNEVAEMQYRNNCVPYIQGEKVRIVFLFQIASFWPSWESLYQSCIDDPRTDTRLLFLDETNTEKSQMLTAKKFLEDNQMEYENFESFSLEDFRPHIVVIQTPYDEWHRQEVHWSNRFRERGYRLVYVPYGVEISDTEDSHKLHFCTNVINNCWRIYTFSDEMKKDYMKYCGNSRAVRALGLPRFDYYFNHQNSRLPKEAEERRQNRPVVLWKVHFPKIIYENGVNITVTPSLEEYLKFAQKIKEYQEFFFVLMPHPKFLEQNKDDYVWLKISQIVDAVSASDNAWIDTAEDYRSTLSAADYIIVDRSAVMVEAGALDVPVLYMTNPEYYEPVTQGIKPLIDSYYQGVNCEDMLRFLEMCKNGRDMMAIARQRAFQRCIPCYDGKSGERVRDDMINGVYEEDA